MTRWTHQAGQGMFRAGAVQIKLLYPKNAMDAIIISWVADWAGQVIGVPIVGGRVTDIKLMSASFIFHQEDVIFNKFCQCQLFRFQVFAAPLRLISFHHGSEICQFSNKTNQNFSGKVHLSSHLSSQADNLK